MHGRCPVVLEYGSEIGVKMSDESQQYMAFTVGSLGVYEFL